MALSRSSPVRPTWWSAYLWISCAACRFRSRGTTTRLRRPGLPSKPRSRLWPPLLSFGRTTFVSRLRAPPASLLLSSDRSFEDYDRAVAQVAEPLAPDTVIAYEQGYLDAHIVYSISSPKSVFSIQTTIGAELGDYIRLTIRYIPLGEPGRAMMITGAPAACRSIRRGTRRPSGSCSSVSGIF